MTTAQQVLVLYGTVSTAVGMLLGFPLSSIRMSQATGPRHLVTAHLSALMQGAMHLGLSVAVGFATASAWVLTTAAGLLVAGSALFVTGAVLNWVGNIDDHFAQRSRGWYLLALSGPLHLGGIAVVLVAVTASVLQ